MLSRVADSVFWMARYVERAENVARFIDVNHNLTLDLGSEEGLALLRQLIVESDAVLENFSPRVLTNFGLEWEQVRVLNPRCLLVRMPAFEMSILLLSLLFIGPGKYSVDKN